MQSFFNYQDRVYHLSFDDALLGAVKGINDSTGPDGLIPTLLVFGAMSMLSKNHDPPQPDIHKRAAVVAKATKSMSQYFLWRRISDAKQQRNGPDVTDVRGTPLGSHVLVYRERGQTGQQKWTGAFILLDVTDSSATVLGTSGPQSFRMSYVKRLYEPLPQDTKTTESIEHQDKFNNDV